MHFLKITYINNSHQANSTSEIFNKTIAKYLASFVDSHTKNWIEYINPMLFAYNTSFHSTTKCTPYFLTYGQEARYPSNPNPDIQHHYGDSLPSKWFKQLQEARIMASHHSVLASCSQLRNTRCYGGGPPLPFNTRTLKTCISQINALHFISNLFLYLLILQIQCLPVSFNPSYPNLFYIFKSFKSKPFLYL